MDKTLEPENSSNTLEAVIEQINRWNLLHTMEYCAILKKSMQHHGKAPRLGGKWQKPDANNSVQWVYFNGVQEEAKPMGSDGHWKSV